jgi:hypothetical protein
MAQDSGSNAIIQIPQGNLGVGQGPRVSFIRKELYFKWKILSNDDVRESVGVNFRIPRPRPTILQFWIPAFAGMTNSNPSINSPSLKLRRDRLRGKQ